MKSRGKFLGGFLCLEAVNADGKVIEKTGRKVYVQKEYEGYRSMGSSTWAETFPSPEAAIKAAEATSGWPWYFKMIPGTAFAENVTQDLERYTSKELIEIIKELRNEATD